MSNTKKGGIIIVTHIYIKDNGDSAFKDLEISFERTGIDIYISLPNPTEMVLAETDASHDYGFHNPSQKQWVITLQGKIKVSLLDGTSRTFGPGSMLLVDDAEIMGSTGHRTQIVSSDSWRCVFVPFNDDVNVLTKA